MRDSQGRQVVIPAEVLKPLMLDWMSRVEKNKTVYGTAERGVGQLARASGVSERRISGILNGTLPTTAKTKTLPTNVSFDTADKLLCAMGLCSAWHVELADYYCEIETASYEKHLIGQPQAA